MADGSITMVVDLDEREAVARLKSLKKSIMKLEEDRRTASIKRDRELSKSASVGAELDEAKALRESMRGDTHTTTEMQMQDERIKALQADFDKVNKEVEKYDRQISDIDAKLEVQRNSMGEIQAQVNQTANSTNVWSDAIENLKTRTDKFLSKVSTRLKKIFIYSLLFGALVKLKKYIGDVMKSNEAFSSALNNLKVSFYTLATPLINVLIPVFTRLLNIITAVVSAIGKFFAMLSGKSYADLRKNAEAMHDEAEAINETGGASADASKSMASFDEINQLSDSSGGGGGGSNDALDFDTAMDEARLRNILDLVGAIGVGLLSWKLGKMLGFDLTKTLGLFMSIYFAIRLVIDITDAWTNGLNGSNLLNILADILGMSVGLALIFGKVGGAVGLLVGSIALLVTSLHDISKNGLNATNALGLLASLVGTGLGIGLLTGNWLPLLGLSIVGLVTVLAQATGHGEELIKGVKKTLEGFKKFFTNIFSGDIETAMEGLNEAFEGIKDTAEAVWKSIKDAFQAGLDWIDDTFTEKWGESWDKVKDVFKDVWNGIISLLESAINWMINGLNRISFSVPDWVPEIGGKSFGFNFPQVSLPRLAQGGVIPPNKEFLAVLGDQKSGMNIETPLDTMIEAFNTALRNNGGYGAKEIVLKCDKYELGRAIVDLGGSEQKRLGLSY